MAIDTTSLRTRRAILSGALGATVAAVAAAVGRPDLARAVNGDVVHVGGSYTATRSTTINAQDSGATGLVAGSNRGYGVVGLSKDGIGVNGSSSIGDGVVGRSKDGIGVNGSSSTGDGVQGFSHNGNGVFGHSHSGYGVQGVSSTGDGLLGSLSGNGVFGASSGNGVHGIGFSATQAALVGESKGWGTGVQGFSGPRAPAALARTGVQGYANQDASAVGVRGQSPRGRGIVASGGQAALRLMPSGAANHPTSGAAGDLFVDKSHRLWFCTGGNPAVWKQVQLV